MLTILILGCNRPENSTRQRCSYGEQSERTSVTMSRKPVGTTLDQKGFPNQSLGGVFWLNAGSALENLPKGIIVQDDPSSIVNGTVTPNLKTRNLLNLAKRASVSVNVQDAFFLSIERSALCWPGGIHVRTSRTSRSHPCFRKHMSSPTGASSSGSLGLADRDSKVVALYRLV
jgi:hypothetical protein